MKIKKRDVFLCVLLLLLSLLALTGCAGTADVVKGGIDIEKSENEPISEQTEARAREQIVRLAMLYMQDDTEKAALEGEKTADKIYEIAIAHGLCDDEYTYFEKLLESRGAELVSAVRTIADGAAVDELVPLLGEIYFDFTGKVSSDFAGALAYGFCIMDYDRKIEEQLSKGTALGNVRAKELTAKKEIVVNDIGENGFSEILRLGFFMRGFFVGGEINPSVASQFTDSELLIFLKRLNFSRLNIGKEGYKLISDYYSDSLFGKETGYFDELTYAANYNGDIDKIAESLEKLPRLISSIIDNMTADDVGLIRKGAVGELLRSVFFEFSDEDWALFDEITSITVKSERYEKIAEEFFGEEFLSYKQSLSAKSLNELKDAVGNENFGEVLEGYIYGISPAFSYLNKISLNIISK